MRTTLFTALVLVCACNADPDPSAASDSGTTGDVAESSTGGCMQNSDCGEAQWCDPATDQCVPKEPTPDSTEDPAPPSFTDKVVPFFRGRVCTVHSVDADVGFPVYMNPCLHPCLGATSVEYRDVQECMESPCEVLGIMWVTADSLEECPPEAFGRFTPTECVYMTPIEFSIDSTIAGSIRLYIPYLSNEDAEMLAADPDDPMLRRQLIEQYLPDENRVVGGMNIEVGALRPAPPPGCGAMGEACDCYDVGF